jgi:hypothetical protein
MLYKDDVLRVATTEVAASYVRLVKANFRQRLMQAIVEEPWLAAMEDTRPCPKCRVIINKADGCNDFACTCSHVFKFNTASWPTVDELQGEIVAAVATAEAANDRKRNVVLYAAILSGDVATVDRCVTDWPHLLTGGASEQFLITPVDVAWLHNESASEAVLLRHMDTNAAVTAATTEPEVSTLARTTEFTKQAAKRVAHATKHGNTAEVARIVARCPEALVRSWPWAKSPIPLQLAAIFGETKTATLLAELTPLDELLSRFNYEGRNAAEEALYQKHSKTAAAINKVAAARRAAAVDADANTNADVPAITLNGIDASVDFSDVDFEMVAETDSDGWSLLDEDTASSYNDGVESASDDEGWAMLHIRKPAINPIVAATDDGWPTLRAHVPAIMHTPVLTAISMGPKKQFHPVTHAHLYTTNPTKTWKETALTIPIKHRVKISKDLLTVGPAAWWEGDHPRHYTAYATLGDPDDTNSSIVRSYNGRTEDDGAIAKSLIVTGFGAGRNHDERRIRSSTRYSKNRFSSYRCNHSKQTHAHSGLYNFDFNTPFDGAWYGLTKAVGNSRVNASKNTDGVHSGIFTSKSPYTPHRQANRSGKMIACPVLDAYDGGPDAERMVCHNPTTSPTPHSTKAISKRSTTCRAFGSVTNSSTLAAKREARRNALQTKLNAAAGRKCGRPKHKDCHTASAYYWKNPTGGGRSAAAQLLQRRACTPINHGNALVITNSSVVVPMYEFSYKPTEFKKSGGYINNRATNGRRNQRGNVQAGMPGDHLDNRSAKRQLKTVRAKATALERTRARRDKNPQ